MKYTYLLLALGCAACSGGEVRNTLGLNRRAPDEFRVVSRPPLSVPREFYLYPPDEAAAHAATVDGGNKARDALVGSRGTSDYLSHYTTTPERLTGEADTAVPVVSAGTLPSDGEEALLGKLGAKAAQPDIRKVLHEETRAADKDEPSVLEKLRQSKPSDPLVDAAKEQQRLKENKQQGKAVNTGDVPTVKPSNSVLDRIF
jgi:Protein of unknown function (DUF3035)